VPTPENLSGGAFRFEDPRQERIHRRLLLVGPGPATFYRDACRLMSWQPPLASTTHLVAHLLREVESGLRDVLETVTEQEARLKKGAKAAEAHKDEIRAILKELEIPETDTVAVAWLRLPGNDNAYGLASRAHRDALTVPRQVDAEFIEFWNQMEAILDKVLEKFEEHYIAWHKQFDQLALKTSPTQADAKFLRLHSPNNLVALGDFFNRLSTPAWLQPLFDEKLFDHPPEPEHDEEKGGMRLWAWPQSRYLARMAKFAPTEVLNIILAIPETKNSWVHQDFAEAALVMPADLAAQLVPKMKGWVEGGFGLLLPSKLGQVMEHLAVGNQVKAALEVMRSLLSLIPDAKLVTPANEIKEDEIKELFSRREPRPRFDAWEYGEIVRKNVPPVVEKAGEQALSVLCDLLEDAVRLSMTPGEKPTANDISHAWRPAIEDHAQNSDYDIKTRLVDAVRDAAEHIARADPSRILALIRSFRKRRLRVFRRLAHHLLRTFPEAEPNLVVKTLLCRGLLFKASLWHEYALLLRESFQRLSPAEQAKILGWIERGPDEEKYRTWHQKFFGQSASEEQVAVHTKAWKRDLLALISDDLPNQWKQRFSELTKELGPSEHPEFSSYTSGGAWGYGSPKDVTDLASLTIEETVDFLRTWEPPTDWMAPSPEGLGRKLTALVASDPERFAEAAVLFCGIDATYVRAMIQGLEEASKKNLKFPWPPVVKLCQWVAEQPREIPGRVKDQREADPDWGWTLKAISSLLTLGLQSESHPIPFELRSEIWDVLQKLVADPEPTTDTEAEYVQHKMNSMEISINTERPKAMHAVMTYAFWVKRNLEAESKIAQSETLWFAKMPEVQKVLEDHLDSETDRSVGVRSVYGQWLASLLALDKTWLSQQISRIFPAEAEQEKLLKAAWDAYVISWNPSGALLGLLREQYMSAIQRIPQAPPESRHPHDSSERLAEHLFLLYGWGRLDATDPLLTEFFTKAPDRVRGHGFHQVGFGLYNEKGPANAETLERFKALWEQRLAAATNAGEKRIDELWTFGWWFASDKLDDDWALAYLAKVLRLTGKVEVDHLVAQRLARIAANKPRQAVECLSLMVDGAKEAYEIVGWEKDAQTVLSAALKSDDSQAKADAKALVNRLDARGHSGFRVLLDG
jgi:hypothetical protein